MAKVDITGLLTGLAGTDLEQEGIKRASAIQGKGLGSNLARSLALQAPQREQMMRQGAGGLFGVDTRTAGQQIQEQLGQLDVTTPAGQQQAVKLVAQIDPTRALALQTQFSEANRTASLDERAIAADELRAAASAATAATSGGEAIGKLNAQFYLPDSIAAFNENLRVTGLKDYSLLERVDPVKEEYQKGVITDIRAANKKRSEAFSSAANLRGKLDTMKELLDSGLQTGALATVSKTAKGLAQYLFPNTPIDGLAEAEVFTALSNQLALLVRNPESGMGLPGATSNADLTFLKESVPGLQKSKEGNLMLIEVYRKTYDFQKSMVQEQARLISENGGVPPLDMEARMVEFVNAQDILGQELRDKIKKGGGESYDKERLAKDKAVALAAREASNNAGTAKRTGKRTIQTK
jgi:hypothetical protein